MSVASHGYITQQGKVAFDGSATELRDDEDVKAFYFGGAGDPQELQTPEEVQLAEAVVP